MAVKTAQAAQNPELATLKFGLNTVGVTAATDGEPVDPANKGKAATLAVPDPSLPTGDYTWKTRMKDQDGSYSAWSATCKFTVARTCPGKPDMSGDTYADMIVLDSSGTISIRKKHPIGPYFDTGTQVSWGRDQFRGKTGQGKLYFADINGDGTKDLISHGTDGNIIVRRNDGTGTGFDSGTQMSAHWSNFLGQPGQGHLYFADTTGYGKADLVVHRADGLVSVRKKMGTYFDGGTPASAYWSNFLDGPEQGRLYFE
ncbi:FG-GAP repeat domain-containing protein [Streptomyces wedmorensis]|uniref:FG-GAP repeat domain-containing protein n=1 Tax=Streptomyces wedmorensis TaxID=43759 RepID=UPI0037987134